MIKLLWTSSLVLATAAFLAACGDETTNINETTGPTTVAAFDDLDDCTAKNEGSFMYVKDSAAAYLCTDGEWKELSFSASNGSDGKDGVDGKDGKDGVNGKDGKDGVDGKDGKDGIDGKDGKDGVDGKDGSNGTDGISCTIKANEEKNGYDLTCGDKVVTVTNGIDGESIIGPQGESCTGRMLENGNIQIKCGDKTIGELTNGADGKSAFELAKEKDPNITDLDEWIASLKGENGTNCTIEEATDGVAITCNGVTKTIKNGTDGTGCTVADAGKAGVLAVQCGETIKNLYKTVCGNTPFDPEEKFCYGLDLYDLCDGKTYNPTESECVGNQVLERPKCGGIAYNPQNQFCAKRGGFIEGVYKKVDIINQTWMAENLNYQVENSWCGGGTGSIGCDCIYYGRLYTWDAAINNSTADENGHIQGICPDGWHLPDTTEWRNLVTNVDPTFNDWLDNNAADDLKMDEGWKDHDGTNGSRFSALPAGGHMFSGNNVLDEGENAYFWSVTEEGGSEAYFLNLNHIVEYALLMYGDKTYGFSVRCIQD